MSLLLKCFSGVLNELFDVDSDLLHLGIILNLADDIHNCLVTTVKQVQWLEVDYGLHHEESLILANHFVLIICLGHKALPDLLPDLPLLLFDHRFEQFRALIYHIEVDLIPYHLPNVLADRRPTELVFGLLVLL